MDNQKTILERKRKFIDEAKKNQSVTPPFPKNILLEVTNFCNHTCAFCSNKVVTRPKSKIDNHIAFSVLEQARFLGSEEVGFYMTGEPLLHPDLELFVRKAKDLGFRYTYISTNGGVGDTARIKTLIDAGLDSVKFSVNAGSRSTYKEIHGKDDWSKVKEKVLFVNNYRKKNHLKLKLFITFITLPKNKDERSLLKDIFSEIVDDISFAPGPHIQGGYVSKKHYERQTNSKLSTDLVKSIDPPCWQLFNRAHITCEGYLTMCCVDYQNYLAVEDLHFSTLIQAWHHPLFQEMRRRQMNNMLAGTICQNCVNSVFGNAQPLRPDLATVFEFNTEKG